MKWDVGHIAVSDVIFLHAQVAVDPHNSALSDMKEGENQEHAGIHLEIGGFELLEMAT